MAQETVAKIDAIGHVNRFMVGLKLGAGNVAPGSEISSEGKKVGEVRSVSWSPVLEAAFGIGFLKRQLAETGTQVETGDGISCEVMELPVA